MSDAAQAALWLGIFAGGLGAIVLLHRFGLRGTYARDLLHVGAGSWALGWPYWNQSVVPILIATIGALALLGLQRLPALRRAVTEDDERWTGLVLYAISAAALTWPGLHAHRFAATSALWALALGDGLGGAVGLRFGKARFSVGGGKRKSVEGSLAVALFAALGCWLAARWTGEAASVAVIAGAGCTAAIAEALAPRGSDNAVVPAIVFALLCILGPAL